MKKVILIYANCYSEGKGDFALAGSIAKDLAIELAKSGEAIDVVLTSTLDGAAQFESLYGIANEGRLLIENQNIGLCALELFDPVEYDVVALIEANRCKFAKAHLIKRVISAETKFLFVGAANQGSPDSALQNLRICYGFEKEQPNLFNYTCLDDMLIGASGLGAKRLGLPYIPPASELPALSAEDEQKIPTGNYGFMYLKNYNYHDDKRTIAQYVQLTQHEKYVLVGQFSHLSAEIKQAVLTELYFNGSKTLNVPTIEYYSSLNNPLMRKMQAGTPGDLVLSTGVMSTWEVMCDDKLPYYQDISNNQRFVATYLIAIKSICSNSSHLVGALPNLIVELSSLLFEHKPLTRSQMSRTQELLEMPTVCRRLKECNRDLIKEANGTLAPRLLSFIGTPAHMGTATRMNKICMSLRKPTEILMPVHDQALRRAAAWGRLVELKFLLKTISPDLIDAKDSINGYSPLHWAVKNQHVDCIRALIKAGVCLDTFDKNDQTPMHHAVLTGNRDIIKLLVQAGASVDVPDSTGNHPRDYATWAGKFLEECTSHMPEKTALMVYTT